MKNKKILGLLLAAVLATGGIATTGTRAYFTSKADSKKNEFKSGTLILGSKGDKGDIEREFAEVTFDNLRPGETYEMASTHLKNVGTLPMKINRISGAIPAGWTGDIGKNAKGEDVHKILENPWVNIRIDIVNDKTSAVTHAYYGMLSDIVKENGVFFNPIYSIQPGETVTMNVTAEVCKWADNDLQDKEVKCDLTLYAEQDNKPNQGSPIGTVIDIGEPTGSNAFAVTAWDDGTNLCFKYNWNKPINFSAYQEYNVFWKKYFTKEQASIDAGLYDIKLYNYDITRPQDAIGTNGDCELKVSWKLPLIGSNSVSSTIEYNIGYFINGKPLTITSNQVIVDDNNIVKINKNLIPDDFKVVNARCGGINLTDVDGDKLAEAFCKEVQGTTIDRNSIVDIINGINSKTLIYTDAKQMSLNRD